MRLSLIGLVTATVLVSMSESTRAADAYAWSQSADRAGRSVHLVQFRRTGQARHDDTEAIFEEGQYEFDARDYKAAERAFRVVIQLQPGSKLAAQSQKYLNIIAAERHRGSRAVLQPRPSSMIVAAPSPPTRTGRPGASPQTVGRKVSRGRLVHDQQKQNAFLLMTGDRVFFSVQSAALGRKARIALNKQAQWLKRQGDVLLQINGHADDGGRDDAALSLRRAQAVRDRLVAEGIAPEQIVIVARGRQQPVATCRSALCAAQNRRVVVRLMRRLAEKAVSGDAVAATTR